MKVQQNTRLEFIFLIVLLHAVGIFFYLQYLNMKDLLLYETNRWKNDLSHYKFRFINENKP